MNIKRYPQYFSDVKEIVPVLRHRVNLKRALLQLTDWTTVLTCCEYSRLIGFASPSIAEVP